MAKQHVPRGTLLEVIGRFPHGASLEEIILALDQVPKRTLQRWLAALVKNEQLRAIGRARARKYKLIHFEPEGDRSIMEF